MSFDRYTLYSPRGVTYESNIRPGLTCILSFKVVVINSKVRVPIRLYEIEVVRQSLTIRSFWLNHGIPRDTTQLVRAQLIRDQARFGRGRERENSQSSFSLSRPFFYRSCRSGRHGGGFDEVLWAVCVPGYWGRVMFPIYTGRVCSP